MLTIHPEKIYIFSANVDMRKSIDGLSALTLRSPETVRFYLY